MDRIDSKPSQAQVISAPFAHPYSLGVPAYGNPIPFSQAPVVPGYPLGQDATPRAATGAIRGRHSYSFSSDTRRRPARKRTLPEQLEILVDAFKNTDSPGFEYREELSRRTGMTNREVQVWFQNRRAKVARQKAAEERERTGEVKNGPKIGSRRPYNRRSLSTALDPQLQYLPAGMPIPGHRASFAMPYPMDGQQSRRDSISYLFSPISPGTMMVNPQMVVSPNKTGPMTPQTATMAPADMIPSPPYAFPYMFPGQYMPGQFEEAGMVEYVQGGQESQGKSGGQLVTRQSQLEILRRQQEQMMMMARHVDQKPMDQQAQHVRPQQVQQNDQQVQQEQPQQVQQSSHPDEQQHQTPQVTQSGQSLAQQFYAPMPYPYPYYPVQYPVYMPPAGGDNAAIPPPPMGNYTYAPVTIDPALFRHRGSISLQSVLKLEEDNKSKGETSADASNRESGVSTSGAANYGEVRKEEQMAQKD